MPRFRNLDGSGPTPGSDVFRWAVLDKLAGRRRKSARALKVPQVAPDLAAIGRPTQTGEAARLTWLGHASWLVQIDGLPLPVRELGWWDTERLGDTVRVAFVPSQHWSRRGLFDTNETLWGGFVIEGPSARIYHAGDTAYFEGFKEIGARF